MVPQSNSARTLVPAFLITLMIMGTLASVPVVRSLETRSRPPAVSSQSNQSALGQTVLSDSNMTEPFSLGALPEDIPDEARVIVYSAGALPTHFDWRQQNGYNWMTPVKNQGGCGSCVAFGAVGALEGQLKIQANKPSWNIDLSEQHLFSCGGGKCSMGWYLSSALNYLQQYGTPDEACSPYKATDAACSGSCSDWQSRAYKIASWSWVSTSPEAIEAALQNGPLLARFDVYYDFFSYTGGVYHHTSGNLAGGHAIAIVGYDSVERYWIVKNSWGSGWGESGYFRIGFGEAGIEQAAASIRVAVSPPPTYTVTYHTDPTSGTVAADGVTKADGETGTYNANQRVHVVANPPGGYQFSYWQTNGISVDDVSSADTYMTVPSVGSLQAHFSITQPMHTVTVFARTIDGSSMPGVHVTFAGQDETTDSSGRAEFSVPAGTYSLGSQTSVNGGSGIQYLFVQWTDGGAENPRSINVDASASYYATYKTQYQLTMLVNPSGSGVTSPAEGTYWFDPGQTVSIELSPSSGYIFCSWAGSGSGSYSGTANPASVSMNSPVREAASLSSTMISGVSVVPDPVIQGSKVVFNVGVVNLGSSKVSSLKVQLGINGPDGSLAWSKSASISKLSGGAQKTIQVAYKVPLSAPPGVWTYSVYLYRSSVLLDQKTDGSFTVDPAIIAGTVVSVSDSPDPVARRETATFTVTVKNTGNIVWSSASVRIEIYGPDGTLVATPTFKVSKKIQPAVEYTYKIRWKVPSGAPIGACDYDIFLNYGSTLAGSSTDQGNTVTIRLK